MSRDSQNILNRHSSTHIPAFSPRKLDLLKTWVGGDSTSPQPSQYDRIVYSLWALAGPSCARQRALVVDIRSVSRVPSTKRWRNRRFSMISSPRRSIGQRRGSAASVDMLSQLLPEQDLTTSFLSWAQEHVRVIKLFKISNCKHDF